MCASSHLFVLFSSPLTNLNALLLRAKIINRQDIKVFPRVEEQAVLGHGEQFGMYWTRSS